MSSRMAAKMPLLKFTTFIVFSRIQICLQMLNEVQSHNTVAMLTLDGA